MTAAATSRDDVPAGPPSAEIPVLFGDLAALFEQFTLSVESGQNPIHDWLDARLPGGGRLLDVGCGAGRHCLMFSERYDQVLGIDPAAPMIDIARKSRPAPNISYQERDAYDVTAEKDGKFDAVFSFSAVFHMGRYERILGHLRSLVAPGGRLVVFDPERTPVYGQPDWQTTYAFEIAQTAYRVTGDAGAAADGLSLFLHPSWRKLSELSVPPSREEFHRAYEASLPGVEFADDLYPGFYAACWQAPAAG
ncbi:class I SAM-dependent methyltransferase [Streptomyces sp. NPDC059037]|uniref:class I SAM-dependent methyltransferase n=1 Tax=Streptomyces sp. NPDC059037 TaxID=3346710 RepID=UPI0036A8D0E4